MTNIKHRSVADRSPHIQHYGLLDLPPEIWSKIVKLAVEYLKAIEVPKNSYLDNAREVRFWHETNPTRNPHGTDRCGPPPITQVCKAIREECLLHYYKSNTF